MGYSVSAFSPINASNNTLQSPFWIPDPWTKTKVSGAKSNKDISEAISQSVNDNAQGKISTKTLRTLMINLFVCFRFSSMKIYLRSFLGLIIKQHWSKAIIFERLSSDIFLNLLRKNNPNFSVIFSNAGAHIQHHYIYNSEYYSGEQVNPDWYVKKSKDPILEVFQMYDGLLKDLLKVKNSRLIIATGLRQVPYPTPIYYWRLRNHEKFLRKLGIKFLRLEPRMTRDFHIFFENSTMARKCSTEFQQILAPDGERIFGIVENEGDKVFVSLTYDKPVPKDFSLKFKGKVIKDFKSDIVFVAIKNGHHDGKGYFFDSAHQIKKSKFHVKEIFNIVISHFTTANKK